MNETDWFYYIALAIATFVVIYIIYISLQFQNNMMEGFSMGGSKSKGDGNQKSSIGESLNKTIDNMFDDSSRDIGTAKRLTSHSKISAPNIIYNFDIFVVVTNDDYKIIRP